MVNISPKTRDYKRIREQILSSIDIIAELKTLGVEFVSETPNSEGWVSCRVPYRPDKNPSGSIKVTGHDGLGTFKDFSTNKTMSLFDLAGLLMEKTWQEAADYYAQRCGLDEEQTSKKPANVRVIPDLIQPVEYVYRDANGTPLFKALRCYKADGSKTFGQFHWSDGKWLPGRNGIEPIPYRLDELVKADPFETVFITEGEKDADNLRESFGLVTTCNVGGAGKWTDKESKYLEGRNVILLADNDEAGEKHVLKAAESLVKYTQSVKIIRFPELPAKADVSDFLHGGGILDELLNRAEEYKPDEQTLISARSGNDTSKQKPVLIRMSDVEAKPVTWLWKKRIPRNSITLLVGRPGCGKSWFTCDLAARVSNGSSFPDGTPCEQGQVILIASEDALEQTIKPRLDAHGADCDNIYTMTTKSWVNEEGELIEEMISLTDVGLLREVLMDKPDCRLVVIDPVGNHLEGKTDAHRDNEVRSILAPIARLAEEFNVSFLIVCHTRKAEASHADDMALGSRGFVGIARAVWHLMACDERPERKLLLPGKCNLAAAQPGMAFTIEHEPARVCWEEEMINESATSYLNKQPDKKISKRDEAEEWLKVQLADGPKPGNELKTQAKEDGISPRTLERARKALDVECKPGEFGGSWVWSLSPEMQWDQQFINNFDSETFFANSISNDASTPEFAKKTSVSPEFANKYKLANTEETVEKVANTVEIVGVVAETDILNSRGSGHYAT